MKSKLNVEIESGDIDIIKRLGKPEEGNHRPILLRLLTSKKKLEICKNKNKLKGSDIYITEDYLYKIRKIRNELRKKNYRNLR